MLLISFDFYDENDWRAITYILLGKDGKPESWGGMKPADHTAADAYRFPDQFPYAFEGRTGLKEDDMIYILDDGRIMVTDWGHEEGGLLDCRIFDPRQ